MLLILALTGVESGAGAGDEAAPKRASAVVERMVDGVAFDDRGRGTPVVLLSGTGLDRRLWDDQVEVLAESYRVLRLDPRGLGRSPVPVAPYDRREDVKRILSESELSSACLVGQSGAAAQAIDFTLEYPGSVTALVLVAPGLSGFPFPDEEIQRFRRIASTAQSDGHGAAVDLLMEDPYLAEVRADPDLSARVRRILIDNDQMWHSDITRFATSVERPAFDRLSEIRAPMLVLVGDADLPVIRQIAQKLEGEIAGARSITVEGAGHLLPLERPAQTSKLILEHLQEYCR